MQEDSKPNDGFLCFFSNGFSFYFSGFSVLVAVFLRSKLSIFVVCAPIVCNVWNVHLMVRWFF